MKGYHGRLLEVDLSAPKMADLPLTEEMAKKYIGGATLAAALVYDRMGKGAEPLAPENPLVFATGPFTGTPLPMVSRYAVGWISPLTGFWGEATSGGRFPFRLKGSGWDGLFVRGKADKPVYLYLRKETRDSRCRPSLGQRLLSDPEDHQGGTEGRFRQRGLHRRRWRKGNQVCRHHE
jgi:aldehyde:ferredoxin oxidoreductase